MYKLKDFAQDISVAIKDAQSSPFDRFVGLEHYDSGEPVITRYTDKSLLSSSVKEFRKNDILIARRNVYLKRAGIAFFDGLTSGDSIVLRIYDDCEYRTGISKQDAIRIIPFILNSNVFWAYANKHADGMNSKRISKEMLYDYEFDLPPMAEQKVLADKLWAAYRLKESYKKLLTATEEMVKSQFIEMFGNPLSSVQRYPLKKLGDCCELNPRRPSLGLEDTDNVSFVPMPSVSENGYLQDVTDEEYGKVKKGFTYFENGDVLFAKITPCMENGKGAIAEGLTNNIGMGSTEFHVLRPIENVSSPYWLLALTRLPIFRERASKNMTGTGGQKRVPANYLENFMVGLPPIEEQNRFENIYNQADKSGFELRKSIEAIDKVIKSLINENL
ncbi:restriction endonuclease subunit S [Phocaeicola oris]|uniref:restriction endonuclease subunit S n=1 Tax=Phocaeicola oris TaxID=2896850 RepID=UPI00234F80E6|nr:restriction endonuclease subunit S [Phocaeicola oris]MCE2616576.1 restriction endonuclease subunit S [Phocaeicola oris]